MASFEREGRYVQHNMGLIEQGDVEEFYLIKETEKRLDASNSTLTFQSFEMKEKKNKPESPVSLVRIIHLAMYGALSCLLYVVSDPPPPQ